MTLNAKQIAFLRFHAEGVEPHYWTWNQSKGVHIGPPPWDRFTAVKYHTAPRTFAPTRRQITISREELYGLRPYWTRRGSFRVNKKGRALIAANDQGGQDVRNDHAGAGAGLPA